MLLTSLPSLASDQGSGSTHSACDSKDSNFLCKTRC